VSSPWIKRGTRSMKTIGRLRQLSGELIQSEE
jgi:hypothetical protein